MTPAPLFGCIEAGGTKFICDIASAPDDVRKTMRLETTTPSATIGAALDWMAAAEQEHGRLAAIGIASFGPLMLDRHDPNWGRITSTPKRGWALEGFAPLTVIALRGWPVAPRSWRAGVLCCLIFPRIILRMTSLHSTSRSL